MVLPTRPSHDFPSRQRPADRQAHARPKTKLKCLVLGATSAGKTSIVRRYFDRTFAYDRVPTQGSDWYTKHLQYPLKTESKSEVEEDEKSQYDTGKLPPRESVSISLQLWDTPGRERLDAKRPERRHQPLPSLHASFLQQADAYMLVYDVTSSTSFKQLLKWYVDLIGLLEKTAEEEQKASSLSSSLPILIVGTKVDLLRFGDVHLENNVRSSNDRRSVLGLQEKDWKGHNYQYEYQISTAEPPRPPAHAHTSNGTPTTDFSDSGFNSIERRLSNSNTRRMEISSYLADRENWTTDWGYLNGVLSSEDSSHPDRDMVKLWCARNNLKHMEASAATGQGVDEVIDELVTLAMRAKQHRNEVQKRQEQEDQLLPPQSTQSVLTESLRYNRKLDLHQRYASKEDQCCLFRWLRVCRTR